MRVTTETSETKTYITESDGMYFGVMVTEDGKMTSIKILYDNPKAGAKLEFVPGCISLSLKMEDLQRQYDILKQFKDILESLQ